MAIQQETSSKIQIRINFQKNPDMIQKLGSKASYRMYGPEYSVVCTIIDGLNIQGQSKQHGVSEMTNVVIGQTANLRLSQEQFEMLNSELHEVEGIGAEIVFELDSPIAISKLTTKKDGVVISFAIYPGAMIEVEPMKVQRVGQILDMEEILQLAQEARERQEQQRQDAISTRATKESANAANSSVTADIM